jgi:uncharacterized membrane protein
MMLDDPFLLHFVRWLHVASGVMWVGLLWYLNFVQVPTMPKIPDEMKPAIGKHIAPAVLFWFRWSAASTVLFGLLLAWMSGYIGDALAIGTSGGGVAMSLLGIAMWFGLIMAFNVWFVIWPNQKIALGIIDAPAEKKPTSARRAMLFSRTNTLLSIPMLYGMIAFQNSPF